jgi:spore maturation protein CgeB
MVQLLEKELKEFDVKVDVFDFTKRLFRSKGVTLKNRILDRVLASSVRRKINLDLRAEINTNTPDVFIVSKGVHVSAEVLKEVISKNILTINWNPDDYFNPLNSSASLLECFRHYDVIINARTHLNEEYKSKGAKNIEFIEWYYDPKIHQPVDKNFSYEESSKYDVAYIGAWSPFREKLLSNLYGYDVNIWGGGWHKASKSFCKEFNVFKSIADSSQYAKIIASAKINLNIMNRDNRDYTNLKIFEIPACGGFLLTNRNELTNQYFEEGIEISCYEGPEELRCRVEEYLIDEKKRKTISKNGYKRLIRDGHSIGDRVKDLMKIVKKYRNEI